MKRVASLVAILAILACGTGAWAALAEPGPLPGYHGFSISVANSSSTYLMNFPSAGSGMNAEWVGPADATSKTGLTTISAADSTVTGSVGLFDTGGGGGGVTDFILLMSVAGSISSNFSVNLAWGANNETFTISDFIYGPQVTKPGSSDSLALYSGQNIGDPATSAYLMFVDLQAGGNGLANRVAVTYTFTGLYDNTVAFNMYGFSPTGGNISPGIPSINWTNNTANNGYVIHGTATAPVPVPPSLLLLAGGLGGLGFLRRKRAKR